MVKRYLVTVSNSKIRPKNGVENGVETRLLRAPRRCAESTMVKRYPVTVSDSKMCVILRWFCADFTMVKRYPVTVSDSKTRAEIS